LAIGETGAIVVDEFLRTSDHDIFAGGDCVESYHQITKKKIYLPLGSIANRHGRVIAENLTGNWMEFPAVLGAFLMKSFDINVGAVGLSEKAAIDSGCVPTSVWGSFSDKPDYYPESKVFTMKMTYCRHGGHLIPLGLQAIGAGDVCRRIDVFSALLGKGSTIVDLLDFEHGYAPPYSEAVDPLQHLAAIAIAKERGLNIIGPDLACIEAGKNAIYLDVRETEEAALEILPLPKLGRLINIPLNDLGDHLAELDRQSEIVVICKRGPRAYQAAVILKNAGYNKVKIVGGGIQAMQ
jgi:rhodanese-related sulfurtransferase